MRHVTECWFCHKYGVVYCGRQPMLMDGIRWIVEHYVCPSCKQEHYHFLGSIEDIIVLPPDEDGEPPGPPP